MNRLRAGVEKGRLVLDESTTLPDGTVVDLVADDESDDLTDQEREALHDALSASWKSAEAGELRPALAILNELRSVGEPTRSDHSGVRRTDREIDDWWRSNRPAAPDLFLQELASTFDVIGWAPEIGRLYRRSLVAGTRRILLAKSRYHVYYVPEAVVVKVLAVWHARRGIGPLLRVP